MKDSLISSMPIYDEGWLVSLGFQQYILLGVIIVLLVASWWGTRPSRIKNQSEVKGYLYKGLLWAARIIAVFFLTLWTLEVLGLGWNEFFSTSVITIADEVPVSPFFILTLIFGIYLLVASNMFIKSLVIKAGEKWGFDRGIGRQLRRFFMLFLFAAIGGFWLKIAGSFLMSIFSDELFSVKDVRISLGSTIYLIIILYGVSIGVKLVELLYTRHTVKKGLNVGQSRTVFQLFKYAFWLVVFILLLESIGLDLTVLLAGSAALLVGLGIGIQGLFNDYVSGLVLLFEGSIKVGHVVEIGKDVIGRVMDVGLRTSTILTRDNIIMIVPNHLFVQDNVINWSYNEPKTRFYVDVGVAYGSDVRLVEKLLIDCALEHKDVIADPKPFVFFRNFGDSSLDFRLYFWVEEVFYVEKLRSALRFAIDEKFRAHHVEIPFPQRDLHLKSGWEKMGAKEAEKKV